MHQMALQEVELTTSGQYVCQITMDSPPFEFVEDGGRLTVISLPERFPVISGNKGQTYTLGDWVDLNCTCYDTYPAASVRWFINGKEVNISQKGVFHAPFFSFLTNLSSLRPYANFNFLSLHRHYEQANKKGVLWAL